MMRRRIPGRWRSAGCVECAQLTPSHTGKGEAAATAVTTVPYCGRWAERCVSEHTTRVVATQATARRGRPYFDPDWTPTCPIRL